MKRDVLNSPRLSTFKKNKRKAVLNKVLIFSLGLLVVFAFLAYLSHLNSLNIKEVEIVGNKVLDADAIKTEVNEQIGGKYLWLFPKTNILYYPQSAIRNDLQNEFKRIKEINLQIKDNKILQVSLTEREAKYIWCGSTLPAEADLSQTDPNSQKCYFMDENGYIFDTAPYFSGDVYFKFYGLAPDSYFSKQNFGQLIAFKDVLIGLGLKPVALYLTEGGDIQVLLSQWASSTTEPKIILRADSNFQEVAENLEAALTTEPLKSKFKNKYSSLQYIDLRFGNKVYDKFLE